MVVRQDVCIDGATRTVTQGRVEVEGHAGVRQQT